MDPLDPENNWWTFVALRSTNPDALLAARFARKAAAIGVYVDRSDALAVGRRVRIRAVFGSYLPEPT